MNLIMAWVWIVLGFVGGSFLGLQFHREDWLGGYGSHHRRLYRLGHISFFGLGIVNLLFYLTAQALRATGPTVIVASWGFLLGAATMPVCCVLMAHRPQWRGLFVLPVTSLLSAGLAILLTLFKL
jgi:hypothetical protein